MLFFLVLSVYAFFTLLNSAPNVIKDMERGTYFGFLLQSFHYHHSPFPFTTGAGFNEFEEEATFVSWNSLTFIYFFLPLGMKGMLLIFTLLHCHRIKLTTHLMLNGFS
jgi:hypothetical protein